MAEGTPESKSFIPIEVGDHVVTVHFLTADKLVGGGFNGEKMHHAIERIKVEKEVTVRRRKKQVVIKRYDLVYGDSFVADEVADDILHADSFTMKHDGSCGLLKWDGSQHQPFTRYDVKRDKTTGEFNPPDGGIPCEEKPTTDEATHWPHMVPCKLPDHKWHLSAFELAKPLLGTLEERDYTIEWFGRKFNYKWSDPTDCSACIVPHGSVAFDIPMALRTPKGFAAIFNAIPNIEGLVARRGDRTYKIRRDTCEGMRWPQPDTEPKAWSERVALIPFDG